jgi:hypothetical protein
MSTSAIVVYVVLGLVAAVVFGVAVVILTRPRS